MRAIDRIAKTFEAVTNGYRYPKSLIGRTDENLRQVDQADILVIAAHPDDEALGLGTILCRHRNQGDSICVVFTTNGRGGAGWITSCTSAATTAKLRYQEACDALSVIDVPSEQISCLGFPDGGLYRYAKECMSDVEHLIHQVQPRRVYVHSLDGGHVDHDITSVIVRVVCKSLKFYEVYEWAEYNSFSGVKDPFFVLPEGLALPPIVATEEEKRIKDNMLAKYASQSHVVNRYRHKQEAVRKACLCSVYDGPTLYPKSLRMRASSATRSLQLRLAEKSQFPGGGEPFVN